MNRSTIEEKILLTKFSVSNFKNFSGRTELDLASPRNRHLHDIGLDEGVVVTAVVSGPEGSGKTNLALALFDIVLNLTDNAREYDRYDPYLNAGSKAPCAEFEYAFMYAGERIVYSYAKSDARTLLRETLTIGGGEVLRYDFSVNDGFVLLKGAERLDLAAKEAPVSAVKYVADSHILSTNYFENRAFFALNAFANHMLMFDSHEESGYQGFLHVSDDDCVNEIARGGRVGGFERFLRGNGADYRLVSRMSDGDMDIFCRFGNLEVPFRKIASTGERSLAVLYRWLMVMDDLAFVYIDDFDAFYSLGLAERILTSLKNRNRDGVSVQIILSTHDERLMSDNLLVPECRFSMEDLRVGESDAGPDEG